MDNNDPAQEMMMTVTSPALDAPTLLKLETALIKYDERQARGKRYNPYALGIYLRALGDVKEDVRSGEATLAQALHDHFNDRLLTALEKAVGLPVTYGGGGHDKGRPDY